MEPSKHPVAPSSSSMLNNSGPKSYEQGISLCHIPDMDRLSNNANYTSETDDPISAGYERKLEAVTYNFTRDQTGRETWGASRSMQKEPWAAERLPSIQETCVVDHQIRRDTSKEAQARLS